MEKNMTLETMYAQTLKYLEVETPVPSINIVIEMPTIGYCREGDRVIEILDEEVLYKNGCFSVVRRWLRGIHPECGQITKGYTGWETLQEVPVFRPMKTFIVEGAAYDHNYQI